MDKEGLPKSDSLERGQGHEDDQYDATIDMAEVEAEEASRAAAQEQNDKTTAQDEAADMATQHVDNSQVDEQADTTPTGDTSNLVPNIPAAQPGNIKQQSSGGNSFFKKLKSKKILIPVAVLVLLTSLAAVPVTRFAVGSFFVKKDVVVMVRDSSTKDPVSDAVVKLAGQEIKTDGGGKATFRSVAAGQYTAQLSKKYYKDGQNKVTVGVLGDVAPVEVSLSATGRQVALTVLNKVSGKGIPGATIKAGEVDAKSGEDGTVTIVVPADATKQKLSISQAGFNSFETEVAVKPNDPGDNKIELTPSGKVYFLSKKSGKIDVVKSNLDGTERQVVLPGTGKEDDRQTVMLASRDWKYLALLSKRDSELPKLYLIETASDKLTVMDEGNADFTLTGWADDKFVYTINRKNVQVWQPKKEALKAYDAASKSIKTLVETNGSGTGFNDQKSESFFNIFAIGKEVIFTKYGSGTDGSINVINVDGSGLKNLKTTASFASVTANLYEPKEVYFGINAFEGSATAEYFEYKVGGAFQKMSKDDYDKGLDYPTFLLSPSGKKNFWSEERDGKPVLFTGNEDAEQEKEYQSGDQKYRQYAWYTDEYVLVSLNDSELYIAGAENFDSKKFLKITDYHKPSQVFRGYGGGYGGF